MLPMDKLRQECLKKGVNGIKALGVLFRGLDHDYSKLLSWVEFRDGIKKFGVAMSENETKALFFTFDKDQSGTIDFGEFLLHLRPKMTSCRIDVINEVFDKIDTSGDGILQVEDLKGIFTGHVHNHPKYRTGEWSEEEVLLSFLTSFDSPNDPDGIVTREEFLNYYACVSATVEEDSYFDLIMRQCWGLPQKRS